MSAFTPGPWTDDKAEHDAPYQNIDIKAGWRTVCTIWIDDAPVHDFNAEQNANARLIAAAPDLLEALDQITTEVEEILAYRHTCGDPWAECPLQDSHKPGSTVDIVANARAAIAKARGTA